MNVNRKQRRELGWGQTTQRHQKEGRKEVALTGTTVAMCRLSIRPGSSSSITAARRSLGRPTGRPSVCSVWHVVVGALRLPSSQPPSSTHRWRVSIHQFTGAGGRHHARPCRQHHHHLHHHHSLVAMLGEPALVVGLNQPTEWTVSGREGRAGRWHFSPPFRLQRTCSSFQSALSNPPPNPQCGGGKADRRRAAGSSGSLPATTTTTHRITPGSREA